MWSSIGEEIDEPKGQDADADAGADGDDWRQSKVHIERRSSRNVARKITRARKEVIEGFPEALSA